MKYGPRAAPATPARARGLREAAHQLVIVGARTTSAPATESCDQSGSKHSGSFGVDGRTIGRRRGVFAAHVTPGSITDMKVTVVEGDLLDQDVDAIVNAWNRNIIPWWLLLPQGVSGAIKKRGGTAPFHEVARHRPMPLGSAVHTSAGELPFRAIIHVAGINMLWRASEASIRDSARNAVRLAEKHGYTRLGMPILGAGSGGYDEASAESLIRDELDGIESDVEVVLVRFRCPTT